MKTVPPTYTTSGAASFWRTYSVTINTPSGAGLTFGNSDEGDTAIRMAFSIERNFSGPGPRSLVLYNLAPDTRAQLKKGTRVAIKAGYGVGYGTICIGSVMKVKTERAGPDTTTTMELIDSESFSTMCMVRRSYAAATLNPATKKLVGGVHLVQVLNDIASDMQLSYDGQAPVRIAGGIALGIRNDRYPAGLMLNGTAGQVLDIVLKPQGLTWNIANGALNVVPRAAYDGGSVHILTPSTGLINTPSINEREHVLFQALMNPKLQPNAVVHLNLPQITPYTTVSANPEGYYKIIKTVHRGDTHGNAWDVSCEAERFEGDFGILPVASGNNFAKALVPG